MLSKSLVALLRAPPRVRHFNSSAKARASVTSIDGANINYEVTPSTNFNSAPLLLVPGWAGISYDWGALKPMLAATAPVISFDPRGLGESGPNHADTKIDANVMAHDCAAVLKDYSADQRDKIDHVNVFGVSMGGMVSNKREGTHRCRAVIGPCSSFIYESSEIPNGSRFPCSPPLLFSSKCVGCT